MKSKPKKDKKPTARPVEGEGNLKFIVSGIILAIFLITYIFLGIGSLSRNASGVFAGFFDPKESALKYNFDSFELIFPGELDRIKNILSEPTLNAVVSTTTTTSTATTTPSATSAHSAGSVQASSVQESSGQADTTTPEKLSDDNLGAGATSSEETTSENATSSVDP